MKESSIEEDTIILGAFNLAPSIQHISGIEFKGVQKAIDNLLSDYKRVLKENEELKDIDLTTVHLKGVSDDK